MLRFNFRRSPLKPTTLADIADFTLLDFVTDPRENCVGPLKLNQSTTAGWQFHSQNDLMEWVEHTAAGLGALGVKKGDRIGFLLNSDIAFLALDIACVQANVVSVPLDLSQTIENIIFSLNHSEARVLFVANLSLLNQILPYLDRVQSLKWIILVEELEIASRDESCQRESSSSDPNQTDTPIIPPSMGLELCATLDTTPITLPPDSPLTLLSWQDLQSNGQNALRRSPQLLHTLDASRSPHDLATLIYTPDEDGSLNGVMLSHENLTSTALAAFAEMEGLKWGDRESVVTFLPLTHIFARVMLYGHLYYGHQIYFSSPKRVMKHLQEIRPTILSTVPILLHRVFRKLQTYGDRPRTETLSTTHSRHPWYRPQWALQALKDRGHRWAMAIAQQPFKTPTSRFSLRRSVEKSFASLLFRQWRGLFGGRLRYCLTGGAALDQDIAQFFLKIGLPVYQGYGLTQTSSVVTFNHQHHNIPGTVGQVTMGANCAIAEDGEVLVKGMGVMQGYFHDSARSACVIDEQGWFHTGDLGTLDPQGTLTLEGRKKNLFKLTTGKYVTPLPLEQSLQRSPLVYRAFVVGEERKYCAAILFIEPQTLLHEAQKMGLTQYPLEGLSDNHCILALYESLVHRANCYFPYWSTIKRIQLLPASAYPSSLDSNSPSDVRATLTCQLSGVIDQLYQEARLRPKPLGPKVSTDCQNIPLVSCPMAGQSLNTKLS